MNTELEKLQGTWNITSLEFEGANMGAYAFNGSKIIVTGETFNTVSMGEVYSGTIQADTTTTPKRLDLNFTDGPHKGKASLAIYEMDGNTWKLCLSLAGFERPRDFVTTPGSRHALETLQREKVGQTQAATDETSAPAQIEEPGGDATPLSGDMELLQGQWTMALCIRDGQPLPAPFLKTGKRVVRGNETTITLGGTLIIKARFTVDESHLPKSMDYVIIDGPNKGMTQYGIYEVESEKTRICFAVPGKNRPTEFKSIPGEELTFTEWKKTGK